MCNFYRKCSVNCNITTEKNWTNFGVTSMNQQKITNICRKLRKKKKNNPHIVYLVNQKKRRSLCGKSKIVPGVNLLLLTQRQKLFSIMEIIWILVWSETRVKLYWYINHSLAHSTIITGMACQAVLNMLMHGSIIMWWACCSSLGIHRINGDCGMPSARPKNIYFCCRRGWDHRSAVCQYRFIFCIRHDFAGLRPVLFIL